MAPCEGIPEATWCPDVLLEQVTANEKTNYSADQTAPQRVRKEVGSHNQKKN